MCHFCIEGSRERHRGLTRHKTNEIINSCLGRNLDCHLKDYVYVAAGYFKKLEYSMCIVSTCSYGEWPPIIAYIGNNLNQTFCTPPRVLYHRLTRHAVFNYFEYLNTFEHSVTVSLSFATNFLGCWSELPTTTTNFVTPPNSTNDEMTLWK